MQSAASQKRVTAHLDEKNTLHVSRTPNQELYLQHAPKSVREFFVTLSGAQQTHIMKHVEYLADGIRFVDDEENEICTLEQGNIEVSRAYLEKNCIQQVVDVTYFASNHLLSYMQRKNIQIPTVGLFLHMCKALSDEPHSDSGEAMDMAYRLLWLRYSGFYSQRLLTDHTRGYLWLLPSKEKANRLNLLAVKAEWNRSVIQQNLPSWTMLPARAVKSVWEKYKNV